MSGSKSYEYRISSQERARQEQERREQERRERERRERERREREERERKERERRERERVRTHCEQLQKQLASTTAKLKDQAGLDVTEAKADTIDELKRWRSDLRRAISNARKRLEAQREAQILEFVASKGSRLDLSAVDLSTRNVAKSVDKKKMRKEIETVSKYLASLEDETLYDALMDRLKTVLAAKDADQANEQLLTVKSMAYEAVREQELRQLAAEELEKIADVDNPDADKVRELAIGVHTDRDLRNVRARVAETLEACRRQEAEQHIRQLAAEELDKIAGIDSAEANQVRELADGVSTEQDLNNVRMRVAEILEARRKQEDAQYVQKTLESVLVEMGYEVGDGFTMTEFGGVAFAQTDDPDYALRFQVQPNQETIYTRVVSLSDTTPEQDTKAEEKTCSQIHSAMNKLNEQGVSASLVSERKPGEYPVEQAAAHQHHKMQQQRRARQKAAHKQARRTR